MNRAKLCFSCLLLGLGPALLSSTGCIVYDESLLEDGHDDSHGHGSEGEEVELSDECDATSDVIPVLDSNDGHRIVTTVLTEDDARLFPACAYDETLAGPDIFFKMDVLTGERWHLAITPDDPAVDIAGVLLNSCDPQTCQAVHDQCGAGAAEEITLLAEADETWFVGLDSHAPDVGTEIELIVQRTACGDGTVEHGEPCDDGNADAGDGCDPMCRIELPSETNVEQEPNNQHMEGNVLTAMDNGMVKVAGKLGGPCDADHYIFRVPEGATVTASFLDGGEQACADGHAPVEMRLMRPTTQSMLGMGASGRESGACPSLQAGDGFNEGLTAGEYHLIVVAPDAPPSFDYVLQMTASTPGA